MQIDWFTFGAQIVNFLVLVALLKRFLYGPITQAMAAREERIASRLEEAATKERVAEQEAKSYRDKKASLEARRDRLMAEARADAEAARKTLVQEAREEVRQIQARWQEALRRDQTQAVEALRRQAGAQIVDTVRRVLADLADARLEDQIVATFIDRLRSDDAELPSDGVVTLRTAFPLTADQRAGIEAALRDRMADADVPVHTDVDGDLVCGLEVRGAGWKVAWSVDAYLRDLARRIEALLDELHAADDVSSAVEENSS